MKKCKNSICLLALCILMIAPSEKNHAQNLRDSLNQYIVSLQQNPNDNALREKIISVSLRIKPAPAIPDNANEKLVMGTTFRDGKAYGLAIKSLNEALLIAPWWGEAYKELGITLEFAEKFDETITAFQLYLKTNPGEEMTTNTKNEIAKVKAKKEMANSPVATEASNKNEEQSFLASLEGATYYIEETLPSRHVLYWYELKGGELQFWQQCLWASKDGGFAGLPLTPQRTGDPDHITGKTTKCIHTATSIAHTIIIEQDKLTFVYNEGPWAGQRTVYSRR
jgi:tetratricopeptide (TPR) repeat protein